MSSTHRMDRRYVKRICGCVLQVGSPKNSLSKLILFFWENARFSSCLSLTHSLLPPSRWEGCQCGKMRWQRGSSPISFDSFCSVRNGVSFPSPFCAGLSWRKEKPISRAFNTKKAWIPSLAWEIGGGLWGGKRFRVFCGGAGRSPSAGLPMSDGWWWNARRREMTEWEERERPTERERERDRERELWGEKSRRKGRRGEEKERAFSEE